MTSFRPDSSRRSISSPVPVLYAHWGGDWIRGSERCLLDLIGHLDRERFAPILVCNSRVLAAAATALSVPVLCSARFCTGDAFFPDWRLVADAWRIVRRQHIKLIHVNYIDCVKWLLPAARTARVPVLAHLHLPAPPSERCYSWVHQVARVVGVSRAVTQDFLDDGLAPERVALIYNGVDPERLSAGDARTLRPELGIGDDEVVIVAVASLIHRKGVDILLRAFARVQRAAAGTRLLIVGDGPEREALHALSAELELPGSVFFLGERQDAGAIFRDVADVAASAAREETFGLTLIEAAFFGVPVAAAAIPPHREAVIDGQTGLLAAPDNPEALAEVLIRLVSDPALRRRLGDAGRSRVCDEFLVARYVRQFGELYEELLARPRRTYGWWGEWAWPAIYSRWTSAVIRRRLRRLLRFAGFSRSNVSDDAHWASCPASKAYTSRAWYLR